MKKRLNFLCVVVFLVLIGSALNTGYYFIQGVQAGVSVAVNEMGTCEGDWHPMTLEHVSMIPDLEEGVMFRDSVLNEKSGRYVPAAHLNMMIMLEAPNGLWHTVLTGLLAWVNVIAIIYALVLFIKLIISINKSQIFNWKNVRRLRRMGLALIVEFICTLVTGYVNYCGVSELFSLQGYTLNFYEALEATSLLLGLSALIVAEVFAIGLRMQEEQELTI